MYKGRSLSTDGDFAGDRGRGRRVEIPSRNWNRLRGIEGQSEGSRHLD